MASTTNATAGPSDGITKRHRKRAVKAETPSDSDTGSETDSSEDVTEDEDGVDLTPALDAAILRTLAKIRNKRGVYEGENVLDNELKEAEEKVIKAGIKAMPNRREEIKKYTLADHHRAALLNGETLKAEEDDAEDAEPLTHVQSQYKLRNEAVSAFKALAADSDDEEDNEDGLLTKRQRPEAEVDEDDEEYRRFLLEMGGGEDEVRKILGMGDQPIKTARVDEEPQAEGSEIKKGRKRKAKAQARKVKEDDDFLMNYILNRGWIDRSEEHVPTYEEIVGRPRDEGAGEADEAEGAAAGPSHPWGELDEEDDFDEKAEEFETAYNFRFEEPGATEILTHPREIPSLVRRTDDTRASKRAAKAERKAAEKAKKEEEARRLKGEKRREMEKQMASLRKDLGFDGDGQADMDWDELEKIMDGEFDEGEWERVVGQMLEKQNRDDEEEEEGDEKPEWEDDVVEMEYEDVDDDDVEMHMTFGQADGAGDDEGPINMDADFEGEAPTKKKRKRDRKGKNKADDQRQQPETAEADDGLTVAQKAQKVKQAMEEYKALDHEDMIGDMPTRFKYTKSKPTAFGLTPAEILLATDAELDSIAGLKHIAPYRKQGLGMQGRGISKRISDLKQKLRQRKWGEEVDGDQPGQSGRTRDAGWGGQKRKAEDGEEGKKNKKRMGKKQREREKKKAATNEVDLNEAEPNGSGNRYEGVEAAPAPTVGGVDGEAKEGKKKRKKRGSKAKDEALQIFD